MIRLIHNLRLTPGPWSVGPAHVVAQRHTDDQGRRVTRFVAEACLSYPLVEGQREANARLIAAAPELYEALLNTLAIAKLKWGNLDEDVNVIFKQVEAVIRKARGES